VQVPEQEERRYEFEYCTRAISRGSCLRERSSGTAAAAAAAPIPPVYRIDNTVTAST
jgi:hypothetical protein